MKREWNVRIVEKDGRLLIGFAHMLRRGKYLDSWGSFPADRMSRLLSKRLVVKRACKQKGEHNSI